MKLFFSGAAHEVTGSKHYLEAAGKKILIDCGRKFRFLLLMWITFF